MNIGILGTGVVGEALANALIKRGHHVKMGSRMAGNEKAITWVKKAGKNASEGSFDDAMLFGNVMFVCLNGAFTLEALKAITPEHALNKILIDITNPLDFTQGMPPRILPDYQIVSLGEQVQQTLPGAYVVKTLNTVNYNLMVDARKVGGGNHTLFLSGNDLNAKNQVKHFLVDNFYWKPEELIDLGGIDTARVTEGMVPFWVTIWKALDTPLFNFKVVH